MGINLFKLSTIEDFKDLIGNEELLVVWNEEGEIWDKEMQGKKIYNILKIQEGSKYSTYPDEIILKHKGNIFFNFKQFVTGESKVVKEVFLLVEDYQDTDKNISKKKGCGKEISKRMGGEANIEVTIKCGDDYGIETTMFQGRVPFDKPMLCSKCLNLAKNVSGGEHA